MTCEEAINYIHSASHSVAKPGLERMRALLAALGDPQDSLRFIHVAGTNGKGSVCAMLDSILCAAGYRTGRYTSPFIRVFNERICIGGEPIGDALLAELTEEVKAAVDRTENVYCEFELITAIGFLAFVRESVDVVVLEVGLGGRFDPTNVIKAPLLSIITGIDFDHTQLLGNTLQKIAAEKAGIIKEGCPCVYGGGKASVGRILSLIATQRNAPLCAVDHRKFNLRSMTLEETCFDFGELEELRLGLLGSHQITNVQTVMTALEVLATRGLEIGENAIRRGLATVKWPARFEKLNDSPMVIYDGAHNPQGVRALIKSLDIYFPEQTVNILTGVMADKDYGEMVEMLKPVAEHAFVVTPPENPRALDAKEYASIFERNRISADAYGSLAEGVRAALEDCKRREVPLVCLGSLYLYRPLTDAIGQALKEMS
ncbi:MAG: bifunctional folylpolyglutamate synthase/dihydrofolate synthase [Clostridia bacterium]|nr:bifunctional folylpolyglutamate synthase/dihydrofolate synthase [Clostridia bacterium]